MPKHNAAAFEDMSLAEKLEAAADINDLEILTKNFGIVVNVRWEVVPVQPSKLPILGRLYQVKGKVIYAACFSKACQVTGDKPCRCTCSWDGSSDKLKTIECKLVKWLLLSLVDGCDRARHSQAARRIMDEFLKTKKKTTPS